MTAPPSPGIPAGLDSDAAAQLEATRGMDVPSLHEMGAERARQFMENMPRTSGPRMHSVVTMGFEGPHGYLSVRRYQPIPGGTLPGIVYFHGGGMIIGSLDSYDAFTRHLAAETGAVILSAEYRLAPEHPYPVADDEALAAMDWVTSQARELGVDRAKIGVGGDSAGGSLAATVAITARDAGHSSPMLQLLLTPGVEGHLDRPSVEEFAEGPVITRGDMKWMRHAYYGPDESTLPRGAVPGDVADLAGVAPAIVVTASHDLSRDGAELFGQRLRDAGVQTALLRYPGAYHGFLMRPESLTRARTAMREIGALVAARFAD